VEALRGSDFDNSGIGLRSARENPKDFSRDITKNHEIALHNAESLQNHIPHWTRRSSSSILFLSLFQSLATGHVGVSRYLAWIVRHGSSKPKAEQP
jgi:hypothetical protein